MGTQNYLWHFIFSAFLCTVTVTVLEGRNVTTATPEGHISSLRSTKPEGRTVLPANSSDASMAEPDTQTAHSLLGTALLSPSTMRMVGGEGKMDAMPTMPDGEGSAQGVSAGTHTMSPAFPTAGPGITALSTGTESGSDSSLPPSSAVTSHSSSFSPEGSSAVTPSPQQSSTSSTTEMLSATTSHPSTALVFSTAGVTGVESDTVTAEEVAHSRAPSTASTDPVSITSPASETSESSSMGMSEPQQTSTPLPRGQTTVQVTATSSPMESPLPSTTMASAASTATTHPGEGGSSTMNQESEMTAEPSAKTSHSLPATSLATPTTTKHIISTSVNPSLTGTCSPITLSIQLENVTSTMIQFSWKPQGGTGDSPYTVHLLGKSGEMEKRILNETRTAFKNLLSGHQYQISVDVSSCSENVSTSLTVQTAAEVYSGTTRIKNEVFKPEYQNKSSREFMEFETKFIMEITKYLPQKIQELKNGTKVRIVINSIKEGSVIVDFDIVLDVGQQITKPEVSEAFTEALNMSRLFDIDLQQTVIEARNSCQTDLNDCDQHAACTAVGASYSCQCNKGFIDKSPQVPGRVCQQDLSSEQTTTAPPDTNTTNTTGSEQTTTAPPDTNSTNTTGSEQTTTAPPDTNTTNTTGPEQTTTAPPDTNTTNTTGSELTTTAPPDTNSTNTTGPEQTTTAPPDTNTTNTTGPEQTTTAPPDTNTTNTTGPEQTTTAPPDTNTTNTTGSEQTTTAPPDTNSTNTTGSEQTTTAPPDTNSTNTTGPELTTTAPPDTNSTNTTGSELTTTAPPDTNTTNIAGSEQTTTAPPDTNTTNTTGSEQTTTASPDTNTISTTGSEQTTTAPPDTNTTNIAGSEQTTTVLPDTNTTNTTGTEQTTTAPPDTNTTNTTGSEQTTTAPSDTNTTNTTGPEQTTTAPPDTNTISTTGSEQTTTVPPGTNTTGFTGSTSNSIFTTSITSAPCMPVSVEVQNVTGKEIQLSWTSGSTGSLYNISLMDGNQEINKTTTKETAAVFKHLLPGHEYTISVAVSSCAEDHQTSVTVRTDPAYCFKRTEFCLPESTGCSDLKDIVCSYNQVFACNVWFKSQTFNNTLFNSESEGYKTMSERIEREVVGEMRDKLNDERFNIIVLGFRPGSVVVHFLSLLSREEPVDVTVIQDHLSQILSSKFGNQTEVKAQSLSVQSSTDNSSSWRVAVIVLGVLLGVALVLLLLAVLFYIHVSRRSGTRGRVRNRETPLQPIPYRYWNDS